MQQQPGILKFFVRRHILHALVFFSIVTLLVTVYQNMIDSSHLEKFKHYDLLEIADAKVQSHHEGAAIAFLGLGVQANQMNCPAAIESLVRYSGWNGDVYLLTDQDNCFDKNVIVTNAGMDNSKFHLITVNGSFSGMTFENLQSFKFDFREARKKSFQMKTKLFDYITDPHIHTIAYVDCDVLFGVEGCAKQMIETGPAWSPDVNFKCTHLSRDANGIQGIHAGSFIVHREHSKEALRLWHEALEADSADDDNDAYDIAFKRIHDSLKPGEHNPMSAALVLDPSGKHYEKFVYPDEDNRYCLNHVSKVRCKQQGVKNVQRLVDRFKLRTYRHTSGEGRYLYCTHAMVQPLLYGWFPWSMFKSCPKVEQIF